MCPPLKCRGHPYVAKFSNFTIITSLFFIIMIDSNYFIEIRISETIDAINEKIYYNCRAAALNYNVSIHWFQRRFKGLLSLFNRPTNGKVLNDDQEQTILKYIEILDKTNLNTKPFMIIAAANYLLWSENHMIGSKWYIRFKQRNPQLFARKQKPLAVERTNSQNHRALATYFSHLQLVMEKKNIMPENIWNMDETGFRIGCEWGHIVLILKSTKSLRMMNSENRVTFIETICANENIIFSMLVFKKVNKLLKWTMKNDLNENIVFQCSDTGYANDDIAFDWMQHFVQHARPRAKGAWMLLIMNGFESHATYSVLNVTIKNNIILFVLFSHIIHFAQSLNVDVFQSYKHHHSKTIDKAVKLNDYKFDKVEFLTAFNIFHTQTFKSSIIRHVFWRTGIVPHNSQIVLNLIPSALFRPHTPSFFSDNGHDAIVNFNQILQTSCFIQTWNQHFQQQLKNKSVSQTLLKKYLRETTNAAMDLNIKIRNLFKTLKAADQRHTRVQFRQWQASSSGLIIIVQCRELYSKKKQNEEKKAMKKKIRNKKTMWQREIEIQT